MIPLLDNMQNFGLIRRGTGNAVLEPTKLPSLPDDYVLVRTKAVALNPTDWTTLDASGDDGTIVGCDYAGVVEDVGREAAKRFHEGDRIAGFGHGGNFRMVRSQNRFILISSQETMQTQRMEHSPATLLSKVTFRCTSPTVSPSKLQPPRVAVLDQPDTDCIAS